MCHHDIKVDSLKIIQISVRALKIDSMYQFDQTRSDLSLNVWLWHPSGQRGEETTVSETLPRGRANGFTVLPDRVYRPYIMFSFFNFKYAFLSFIWRAETGAWQQSVKRVDCSASWLHSRGSKRLQRFTFDLKLFLCHFWAVSFAAG